ncbi:MAG: long-chain acyl-CoA synthetase [Paracoccaceae bacterium]|jgi:long-chain acyl-CoA synthetase
MQISGHDQLSADPVYQQLTGPGGDFEIVDENVLGQTLPVFKQRHKSLIALLLDSQKHGERIFMVDGERRISYRQHFEHVKSVAQFLAATHGISKGDRVAIFADNSVEWDAAFWAAQSLGAIVVAMNGWWTEQEFEHAWQLTEPALLLGDSKRLARLASTAIAAPTVDIDTAFAPLYGRQVELPETSIDEDDPALIMFTSGTTGRAKGALISHRTEIGFTHCNRFATAHGMAKWGMKLSDRPAGVTLGVAPFFHMSGLGGLMLQTRVMGDTVVLYKGRFEPEILLGMIEREKVSTYTALGGMGPRIISCPTASTYDLSSLTTLIFGGSPVPQSVQEGLRKVFPNAQGTPAIGYGTTETGSVPVGFAGEGFIKNPTATGDMNALHELEIRDDTGAALADGREGLVWVRSAFNMLRYWNNAEATAEILDANRWLCTGDIGRVENGLLYINSRARDMILRSAENIYPTEIENRLDAHPAVKESAVYGVDDAIHGQAVKAVVVLNNLWGASQTELSAWVGEALAKHKIPAQWRLTDQALPRNATGKVLKDQLRAED